MVKIVNEIIKKRTTGKVDRAFRFQELTNRKQDIDERRKQNRGRVYPNNFFVKMK